MNNMFCFSRLRSLIAYDFTVNRKRYFRSLLFMYAAFSLMYFITMFITNSAVEGGDPAAFYDFFCSKIARQINIVVVCFVAFSFSVIFMPMADKGERISFLMLPASASEKYVARLLFALPVTLVMLFVALLLAELTHFLFIPFFDCREALMRFTLIDSFREFIGDFRLLEVKYSLPARLAMGAFFTWLFSFFLLGGGIWYKNAMVKTFGAIVAIQILLGALHLNQPLAVLFANDWIVLLLFVLLTIFNLWFPYYRFKRSQLIKNKLF